MRRIWLAASVAILAGCSSGPKPAPAPVAAPAPPPLPAPPAAAPISLPPAPVSVAPPPPPDQCGAYELVGLVGKPRSEIPVPLVPSRRRVVCTTCPRTQDYNPARMTIEYDAGTGLVTKVGCG